MLVNVSDKHVEQGTRNDATMAAAQSEPLSSKPKDSVSAPGTRGEVDEEADCDSLGEPIVVEGEMCGP